MYPNQLLYGVLRAVYATVPYCSFFFFHRGRRFLGGLAQKENEMKTMRWNKNENENVFLGPQRLFIWKRNCSAPAVELAAVVPVFYFIRAYCNFCAI
jgi:hypothetical protein